MRVLVLSAEAPRPGSAVEAHLLGICSGLQRSGAEVVRRWPNSGLSTLRRLLSAQLLATRGLRSFDVMYLRWHPFVFGPLLLACAASVPVVLEMNGTDQDLLLAHPGFRRVTRLVRSIVRWQLRRASAAVCVTPGLAGWVRTLAPEVQVTWFPNGAAAELRDRRTAPLGYVAFVGELATWQGIDTVLAAAASAHWPSDVRLKIVGGGVLQDEVRAAAHSTEHIDYLGRRPRDEALEILAAATVSLSAQTARLTRNLTGVSPLKLAESLMVGVPVVVSALPGQTEIAHASRACLVVPADDPVLLASAVDQLCAESSAAAEARRDRAAEYAEGHLSWECIAEQVSDFLHHVVCQSSSSTREPAP